MRRRRAGGRLLALAVAAAVMAACGGATTGGGSAGGTAPTTASAPPSTTPPATTPPTTGPPSSAPATTSPTSPVLREGDAGSAVLSLQRRLTDLGYWLGTPDGRFGDSTEQAVYALQKVAGVVPDGVVGPATTAALQRGAVPRPRSTSGRVVEVNLESQILMFVAGGTVTTVLNTSTGGGFTYMDNGVTAVADTPRGNFTLFRQVDGLVVSSLGALWRPKYFYSGFAIHGAASVPPVPASHGCVRVSNQAIDWIWATGQAPLGTAVWVY